MGQDGGHVERGGAAKNKVGGAAGGEHEVGDRRPCAAEASARNSFGTPQAAASRARPPPCHPSGRTRTTSRDLEGHWRAGDAHLLPTGGPEAAGLSRHVGFIEEQGGEEGEEDMAVAAIL